MGRQNDTMGGMGAQRARLVPLLAALLGVLVAVPRAASSLNDTAPLDEFIAAAAKVRTALLTVSIAALCLRQVSICLTCA